MEGTMAEIRGFAGTFEPKWWRYCDGQLVAVSENPALFSLLGTNFGGDGRVSFGLPDLQGRVMIHRGSRPGGETRYFNETGGVERIQLQLKELCSHNHSTISHAGTASLLGNATAKMTVNNTEGSEESPFDSYLGVSQNKVYRSAKGQVDKTLSDDAISIDTTKMKVDISGVQMDISDTGGDHAHYNMQPYQILSWIICVQGLYPSRP